MWLVELAALADPALVPQAVAARPGRARGARAGRSLQTLAGRPGGRRLLLVLDNCEHLLDACAALADTLLRACPGVRILATSRQALGMPGEVAAPVPPLALPPAPADAPYVARMAGAMAGRRGGGDRSGP